MGKEYDFEKVNLFFGIIYSEDNIFHTVKSTLDDIYGEISLTSDIFTFQQTSYYEEEMGKGLKRVFIGFKKLIKPESLPEIKINSNKIEIEYSDIQAKRKINLDPGFLSSANVIIATTKNHYHRIPLSKGIYAHMEYIYMKGNFHNLDWTYPDFRGEDYKKFFRKLREIYNKNKKGE